MHHLLVTITVAAVILSAQPVRVEHEHQHLPTQKGTLDRSKNRPDLGLGYADAAKLKLASRKKKYRLGEMVSLDLAVLNSASSRVFFRRLLQPNFYVTEHRRGSAAIVPYLIVEPAPTPQLYTLLQPGEIMTESLEVLAGCDKKALQNLTQGLDKSSKELFEQNRFVNWGEFCLRVTRPGLYTITVEQINNDVVTTADEPNTKTAIGVIRSTPLTIEITK